MEKRLQQFLAAEGITQAQFADSIGVTKASISHILSGRNKPGYDFLCNTMKHYPALNIEWLLTGKGKMYKNAAFEPLAVETEPQINLFSPSLNFDDELQTVPVDMVQEKPEKGPEIPQNAQIEEMAASKQEIHAPDTQEKAFFSPVAKNRRVVKVILLFDDGTFQDGVI